MTKQKIMFENIYDLIKATALPKKQNNGWAKLARKHEQEARKELGAFIKTKEIVWDNDNNTISIGKRFKIELITTYN